MKYIEELFALEAAVIEKEAEHHEVVVPLKRLKEGYVLAWNVNVRTIKLYKEVNIKTDETLYIHTLKKEITEILGIGVKIS